MPKKRKEKENVAAARSSRRREETLLKDTTGVEAVDVFKVSAKIGRLLSRLLIMIGAFLSLFSMYSILTSLQLSFSDPLFMGVVGFLGAINLLSGLILLAKE